MLRLATCTQLRKCCNFPYSWTCCCNPGIPFTASIQLLAASDRLFYLRLAKVTKERVDDKCHHNIVGENNTHNVKAEEEEANHLFSGVSENIC